MLGGRCSVESSAGSWSDFGGRAHVFNGLPYALYLPIETAFTITAVTDCDLAMCFCRAEVKYPARLVTPDDVEVEIEYEDRLLSQYPIIEHTITEDTVTLHLTNKHTDCLAKDKCLVPTPTGTACCGPNCC